MVPRIYYDADWPGAPEGRIDLLAIDRNGVGDAHLVEIRKTWTAALECVPRLLLSRAPYRWLAFFRGVGDSSLAAPLDSQTELHSPGQPGRIGLIEIVEKPGDELGANVRLTAERFATPAYEMATTYASTHEAQIQFDG
jgi:hypothetical protein